MWVMISPLRGGVSRFTIVISQHLVTHIVIFALALGMGCRAFPMQQHHFTPVPTTREETRREYPPWFIQPPLSDSIPWAVGYCDTYFRREESQAKAIQDGIYRLAQSLAVRVTGERIFLFDDWGWRPMGENFDPQVPEAVLESVRNHHQVVQSYVDKHLTLALLSLSESVEQLPPTNSGKPMPVKPSWVEQPPQEPGYLYAQGHCDWYYHEAEAWQAAERDALINLALAQQTRLRQWLKQVNNRTEALSTARTDVFLEGSQVVARWRDEQTKAHYVLMRIRHWRSPRR